MLMVHPHVVQELLELNQAVADYLKATAAFEVFRV